MYKIIYLDYQNNNRVTTATPWQLCLSSYIKEARVVANLQSFVGFYCDSPRKPRKITFKSGSSKR